MSEAADSWREIKVIFEGWEEIEHETIAVSEISPETFRLLETPITADPPVYLGDVIEARADAEGGYRFQRVIERSGFRVHNWMIPRVVAESSELAEYCEEVLRQGGQWERIFGGCLIVHLPVDALFDVEKELEAVVETVYRRERSEERNDTGETQPQGG